jgi:hypothetical protein
MPSDLVGAAYYASRWQTCEGSCTHLSLKWRRYLNRSGLPHHTTIVDYILLRITLQLSCCIIIVVNSRGIREKFLIQLFKLLEVAIILAM